MVMSNVLHVRSAPSSQLQSRLSVMMSMSALLANMNVPKMKHVSIHGSVMNAVCTNIFSMININFIATTGPATTTATTTTTADNGACPAGWHNPVQRNDEWVINNSEGQEIGEGPMYKSWSLSFDFKPTINSPGWRTFLHITDGGPGDVRRVLSIWLHTMGARMHYEFDGTTTSGVIPVFFNAPLVLNEWNTFSMGQMMTDGKYHFSATVNNIAYSEVNGVLSDVENISPRDYENVKFFASTADMGPPTEGSLRNLQFCTKSEAGNS